MLRFIKLTNDDGGRSTYVNVDKICIISEHENDKGEIHSTISTGTYAVGVAESADYIMDRLYGRKPGNRHAVII